DPAPVDSAGCDVGNRFGNGATANVVFTVTGGSGKYLGASGSGNLATVLTFNGGSGGSVRDTYGGVLTVPGASFDLASPIFNGARSKTVFVPKRLRTARVAYSVTATDDVDGPVPAGCKPPSGSRFRLGKTRVTCSASDSS